ncbi:hypothetical protein J1614_011389 [Plenodomus biglobosus]|nr:hypothetical protein J1614_011389 [Plenodomus biglobosus]
MSIEQYDPHRTVAERIADAIGLRLDGVWCKKPRKPSQAATSKIIPGSIRRHYIDVLKRPTFQPLPTADPDHTILPACAKLHQRFPEHPLDRLFGPSQYAASQVSQSRLGMPTEHR